MSETEEETYAEELIREWTKEQDAVVSIHNIKRPFDYVIRNIEVVNSSKNSKTITYENDHVLFKFSYCEVKYIVGKYPKLTVSFGPEIVSKMHSLFKVVKKGSGEDVSDFSSTATLSLKVDESLEERVKTLKKGDAIKCLVLINDMWSLNDRWYVSFLLKNFMSVEKKKRVENITDF